MMGAKRLKPRWLQRACKGVDLRSHAGVDDAAGFIFAFPYWWLTFGLLFVISYWLWSLALHTGGVQKGTFAQGIGHDGVKVHQGLLSAGLGQYALDWQPVQIKKHGERAFVGSVNQTVNINEPAWPKQITVQVVSVSREERFYPWTPSSGWE